MSARSLELDEGWKSAGGGAFNPYCLSAREMSVAALLGIGLDFGAIAKRLHVAARVVEQDIARLSDKLGARNGTHLRLIVNTLPGLPVAQPTVVSIEEVDEAFDEDRDFHEAWGELVLVD